MELLHSFLRHHFASKPEVASPNVGCFLRHFAKVQIANIAQLLLVLKIWGSKVWRSGESAHLPKHQCGAGSTPSVDAIHVCGLRLLLVLSLAPRGFSPGTPVFPSPQKPTLPNSNSIWNAWTCLNEFIWTPRCFVGKQAIYNFFFFMMYLILREHTGFIQKIATIFHGLFKDHIRF